MKILKKNEENVQNAVKNAETNIEKPERIGVYVKVNNEGFITAINSDIFIRDFDGWIKIDEGEGERFVHAQTCYFEKPIIDDHGNYNYRR